MTDSAGTVIISDASNMRVKGHRSLNFGLKCSLFGHLWSYECRIVLELDRKDLNSEAKHICCKL